MDLVGFLRRHPPFDALPADRLEQIARQIRIQYFPAGATIIQQAGRPAEWLYVIRKGAVELVDDGRVLDLLMEGESFGHLSLLSRLGPTATVRAHEDTICYLIDAAEAERVLGTPTGLAYVTSTIRRQLLRVEETFAGERPDPRTVTVGTLIRRRPISCEPDETIRGAAERMANERVSSLIVPHDGALGILTDRDLRTRVLAEGKPPSTPVSEVMSFPAITVEPEATAAEVLAVMLEHDFHHLPIVDEHGALLGVVTDTDLMRLERYTPAALKSAIDRAPNADRVAAAGRDLPRVVFALVDARTHPVDIGHVIGITIDALTRRLIDLAVAELGPPPAPWAWLALGSFARHEQALHSDQDHALAFDPQDRPDAEVDPYFAELARRVTDGLETIGIPRCTGGAMAENEAFRRSIASWEDAFRTWVGDIGMEGSIYTSIVFDYRRVTGSLDVESHLDRVIASASEHPQFLRHLARRALDHSPPTGFFRDLVVEEKGEHAGTLDVKHRGITIVTNLARVHGITCGSTERKTIGRLRTAAAAGRIDRETCAGLEEAFRLLWEVRLDHQVRCVRAGRPPDDFVDPQTLGPLTRRGLKEAFRIIERAQRMLVADLGVRMR